MYSSAFETAGKILMGRKSDGLSGLSFFGTGKTRLCFHSLGNTPCTIEKLKISVKMGIIVSATFIIIFILRPSSPIASDEILVSAFRTACVVTGFNIKGVDVRFFGFRD
jgi:hypothetical protein